MEHSLEMGFSLDNSHSSLDQAIDFLIIGGGVAGLASANRFCDLGFSPVIIEAGSYPSHKVCGEFLSPEVLPLLDSWSIIPRCRIDHVQFFSGHQELNFTLPQVAASHSRYELDAQLVDRARAKGARFLCNTKVESLAPYGNGENSLYRIGLSTGETLLARNILIGSGRVTLQSTSNKLSTPHYFGFKAHFDGIQLNNALQMHALPGAYLGISNVKENVVNVACLARLPRQSGGRTMTAAEHVERILNLPGAERIKKLLAGGTMIHENWMTVFAPEFGKRKTPVWPNAYFIGEAAGAIPPATGDGLGIAITSGVMAADYAAAGDWQGFRNAWKKRYTSRILVGKWLHRLLSKPAFAGGMIRISKVLPSVPRTFFQLTRESQG